ncbi:uncharacterized protein B0H18DRAFT_1117786 [Fomitopsis serialis]|uniref:uncharacterized protein n=1 Tax=Fomitopsis serialis TaxID=139415 RepID=UPI0020084602|nr:uncharacterized protein B0H18DRAFT_1117786 [Neoantrodia serialis]KAH9928977.1 hypothetical protein B0H18DRAFT_1117786 [Neoantrodia serialis]
MKQRPTGTAGESPENKGPTPSACAHVFGSYKFRQDSDFWYLTGFEEPGAALIMEKDSSAGIPHDTVPLAVYTINAQWDGARTSAQDVVRCFVMAETDTYMWTSSSGGPNVRGLPRQVVAQGLLAYQKVEFSAQVALQYLSRSSQEHDTCRSLGGQSVVTRPEVDGARDQERGREPERADIHYTSTQLIRENELVSSMRAVIQVRHLQMSISPTDISYKRVRLRHHAHFPASGAFTSAQADLYNALLSAQKQLVALHRARGAVAHSSPQVRRVPACRAHADRVRLGFTGGRLNELYPHSWAIRGDCQAILTDRRRCSCMVITWSRIYVPPCHTSKTFHNIGIRIEDEVLVGEEHPVVLSASAPKEIADVEGACQGLLGLEPF